MMEENQPQSLRRSSRQRRPPTQFSSSASQDGGSSSSSDTQERTLIQPNPTQQTQSGGRGRGSRRVQTPTRRTAAAPRRRAATAPRRRGPSAGVSEDDQVRTRRQVQERKEQLKEQIKNIDRDALEELLVGVVERQPSLLINLFNLARDAQPGTPPPPAPLQPDWCQCGRCRPMPTVREQKCCDQRPEQCLSLNWIMDRAVLDPVILRIARNYAADVFGRHAAERDPNRDGNDCMRHAAYRQWVLFVYNRLGRGNRVVIPSCVVLAIRNKFPSLLGQYTGFRGGRF